MSLGFIVFGTFWAPCTCISVSFPSLGKILATIFQIIFLVLSLFLPFGKAVPIMQASFQRLLKLSPFLNVFILLLCLGEFSCFVPHHWFIFLPHPICSWITLVYFSVLFPLLFGISYFFCLSWSYHCVCPFLSWVQGETLWLVKLFIW